MRKSHTLTNRFRRLSDLFRRSCALAALSAVSLALFLHGQAAAQSTDPNSPTPLTAGEIAGGEVAERASYYFTFEGGPGEVTAALSAKMKKGAKAGSVGVEIFDANAKSIASTVISGGLDAGKEKLENELLKQLGKITSAADSLGSDTKQKTARVKIKQKQPLVLKLTVDQGVESFTLKVGGAVEFASADSGTTPTDATSDTGAMPTDQAVPTDQTIPTDQTTSTEQTTPTDETTPTSEAAPTSDAQPTSGKPAVKIPGKKPVLLKVPGKQATPQTQTQPQMKPPVILRKPQPVQTKTQTVVKKPAVVIIPKKKQP